MSKNVFLVISVLLFGRWSDHIHTILMPMHTKDPDMVQKDCRKFPLTALTFFLDYFWLCLSNPSHMVLMPLQKWTLKKWRMTVKIFV